MTNLLTDEIDADEIDAARRAAHEAVAQLDRAVELLTRARHSPHPVDQLQPLGAIVARRRKALGLSARDLAMKAGCSRNYVLGIERNERHPRLPMLANIARALEVTPGELLDGADLRARTAEGDEQ